LPILSIGLKLAVVYNRPVTELNADLYRQIQEEVGVAQAVPSRYGSNLGRSGQRAASAIPQQLRMTEP